MSLLDSNYLTVFLNQHSSKDSPTKFTKPVVNTLKKSLLVGFMLPFKYKERPGYNPKANNSMPMNNVNHGTQGNDLQYSLFNKIVVKSKIENFVITLNSLNHCNS